MALMTIIIKAIDKASEVATKVGNVTKGQMDKITQATDRARQAGDRFTGSIVKTGQSGMSAYAQLNPAQQEYINKVTRASGMLDRMGLSGTRAGNAILKGYDLAHNGVMRVTSGVETLKQKIASTTVGQKFINSWDIVKNKVEGVAQRVRTGLGNALDNIQMKAQGLQNSMGELGMAITSAFGALGMGSISQATIGLAMTREQMTALMTATMGNKNAAVDFINTLDTMTNSSLVSLNDLGGALAKIKMSTGMTNEQLKLIAPTVNDIGQRAILMGYDAQQANDLMVASFRGLNGEFDMLKTNFGITRQNLIDAGWSGAATDVEGYNAALQKCLERGGSMEEMLKTTPGQIALMKKAFSTAGREIGEAFIPIIKSGLEFGLWLKETNPWVFKLAIVFGALVSAFAMALPVLDSVAGGFKNLLIFLGILENKENMTTLATIRQTVAEKARAVAHRAGAAATGVAIAAQKAYAFATSGNVIATVRATAAMVLQKGAMIAGAAATWLVTAAQTALNLVMSMNPIALVVIAIVALIAVLAYLYNSNEQVRAAIDWLWSSLQQLGNYIWGGLVAAWNALVSALAPVGAALSQLGGAILGRLMDAWNGLLSAIRPLTDALGTLWAALSGGASTGANDFFSQFWGILSQVWGVLVQVATVLWDVLSPALTAVSEVIMGFFGAALQTVWGILSGIITFIATFITALANLIAGNITFGQFMQQVWSAVQTLFTTVIGSILGGIGKFAFDLVNKGVNAAKNFLTGIITWISQLPTRIWAYLLVVITKVMNWKDQMVARAKETGQKVLNNVITFISQLPSRVWSWLMSTISRMASFVSQAASKASQAGSTIISNIASYLSSLPGKMYQWGLNAINSFINAILNAIPGLRDALNAVASLFPHSPPKEGPLATIKESNMRKFGEDLGNAFSEGINTTTKDIFTNIGTLPSSPMPVSSPAPGAMAAVAPASDSIATVGMDTSALATESTAAQEIIEGTVVFAGEQFGLMQQTVGNSWNQMATTTRTGFEGIKNTMRGTLSQIVANNQAGYNSIRSNTASTMTALVNNNRASYSTIQKNMSTTLTAITTDNRLKYNSILNTTKSTLNDLQGKTNSSMNQVKSSWNSMRNSLISAASQVRSQTTSEINHLSGNIATFYRKIRNPILFLAGPMPYRYRNRSISSLPRGGYAGTPKLAPRLAGSRSEINQLESSPGLNCKNIYDCHYAGWDYSDTWVNQIMRYIKGYKPMFGDLGNMGLTVGDFENSTMPIMGNMAAFDAVARKLIGGTRYSFYFDSRYGSPYAAAASGAFNCYDGALIMLALANAFGLSGYMAHGFWGDVGHVWAVINGRTYDTTAYQGGYGWSSPKVRGAGAVTFDTPTNSVGAFEPITIQDSMELRLILEFEGLPDSIDDESLKAWLMTVINDSEVVKKLVKDRNFKEYLKLELKKTERKDKRVNGS